MSEQRPRITPIKDGALRVEGLQELQTEDGTIECGPIVALCRCGRSANKPFCDGTHVTTGFSSDETDGSEPDRRDDFVGKEVTIHDNRDICAHAGHCTDGLPNVFRHGTEPWIDPDQATTERVIETIRKCPSGALSYSIDGVELRNPAARQPDVSITVPGPYALTGSVELDEAEWAEGASEEHFELCRCGGSKRKPFCDGSHWEVWKSGAETKPAATSATGPRPTPEEPHVAFIHELAANGLARVGEAGPMVAMGVPRDELPKWDDIQIMTAQLDPRPLLDDAAVGTDLVIGPRAKKPLRLEIPLFVSDMSFGALSEEAKVSLARGAELAGTGICSGEGGMLPEEQAANNRYFYEYASGAFGFEEEKLARVQAMHFKAGQGAKTGTGGRPARVPRPEPEATCPAPRWSARSPRSVAWNPVPTPSPRRPSRTSLQLPTSPASPTAPARSAAASPSASRCRPTASNVTSTLLSTREPTTSSSTAAVAGPAPLRASSATTSPCPPSLPWRGRGGTWTPVVSVVR